MIVEAGVVAGYMTAWAVRKVRRVASGVDAEVDEVIDAELEKLHTAVATKLRAHPALDDLAEEAAANEGHVSELTRQQVELAVTAAAKKDDGFGLVVTDLVANLRAVEQESGISVLSSGAARVFTGNAHAVASGNGISFGQVGGDVHVNRGAMGRDQPGPSVPGRSRP